MKLSANFIKENHIGLGLLHNEERVLKNYEKYLSLTSFDNL
jgi:hypothetical protein